MRDHEAERHERPLETSVDASKRLLAIADRTKMIILNDLLILEQVDDGTDTSKRYAEIEDTLLATADEIIYLAEHIREQRQRRQGVVGSQVVARAVEVVSPVEPPLQENELEHLSFEQLQLRVTDAVTRVIEETTQPAVRVRSFLMRVNPSETNMQSATFNDIAAILMADDRITWLGKGVYYINGRNAKADWIDNDLLKEIALKALECVDASNEQVNLKRLIYEIVNSLHKEPLFNEELRRVYAFYNAAARVAPEDTPEDTASITQKIRNAKISGGKSPSRRP